MWRIFQKAEYPPAFPGVEEDPNPTIFDWTKNRRAWIHLSAFLMFSVIIHGSGFYLFQVVYPSPTREKPRADSILVMDPADPSVRSLLQRVGDRMTFLLPPSEGADVQVSIEELPIRFTPAFQTIETRPADLVFPWTMPPSAPLLSRPLSAEGEAFESRLKLSAQGDLINREVAPWSILGDYLELADEIPSMRLRLSVDREGMVVVEDVDSALDPEAEEEIKQVVESTLRYLPAPVGSEGWLTIRTGD